MIDPTEHWLGRSVMRAYDISKQVNVPVVPVIAPLHDDDLMKGIPQLHDVLGLDRENTQFPRVFMVNGRDGTAVEYPHELDEDLLPGEVLVLWARRTLLYQDVRYVKEKINELNNNVEEGAGEAAIEYAKNLKTLKDELKIVKAKHEEVVEFYAKQKEEKLNGTSEQAGSDATAESTEQAYEPSNTGEVIDL